MGIVNQDTKFNGFFSPFSVDNPNRVVITNNQGYAIASAITYQQLLAVISGGGTLMGADNGLHTVGTVVKLGGTLLEPTIIDAGVLSFTVQNGLNNTYMSFAASGSSRGFSVNAYSDSLSDLGYLEASIGKVLLQYSVGANRKSITLSKTISGIEVFDQLDSVGLRYNSNYSANNTGANFNARWIPDLGYLTSTSFTSSFILNQNSVVQTPATFRISDTGEAKGFLSVGSFNATSGIARGNNFTNTLTATANNDTLVGIDVNPTFNTGAFTGLSTYALRVQPRGSAHAQFGSINNGGLLAFTRGSDGVGASYIGYITSATDALDFGINHTTGSGNILLNSSTATGTITLATNSVNYFRMFLSGNVQMQNGGVFVDNGYRLDVIGRVKISGSASASAGVINFNLINPSLTATANGDDLIALNINPSYTVGAFTGVKKVGLFANGIIRGTASGSDLVLETGAKEVAFRAVRANAWADSVSTMFFQVGNSSSENVAFTSNSGTVFNRLQFTGTNIQFGSVTYNSTQAPTHFFEVLGTLKVTGATVNMASLPTNATTDFDVTIDASGNLRRSSATIANSYILNQNASVQTGSWFINGNCKIGGSATPVQKLEVLGTDAAPAISGVAANGSLRVGDSAGGGYVIDFGVASTNGYSWIQSRMSSDQSVQRELRINPNGGNTYIGATAEIKGGAEALKVGTNTGNPDNAFIGFYRTTASPTVRSGLVGYSLVGSNNMFLRNELVGTLNLITAGSAVGISATGSGASIQGTADLLSLSPSSSGSNWQNVLGVNTANENSLLLVTHLGGFSLGSKIKLRTSSGNGAVGITASGNILGQYTLGGYVSATTAFDSLSIQGKATELWSGTAGGSKLEFYTTPNTTLTQTLRLTLDQDGTAIHFGGIKNNIRTVSATTTALVSDWTILCDATSGAITLNLPSAASAFSTSSGQVYNIKKINNTANNITIDPNGAELIDGAATFTLSTFNQVVTIQSNGTAWYIAS